MYVFAIAILLFHLIYLNKIISTLYAVLVIWQLNKRRWRCYLNCALRSALFDVVDLGQVGVSEGQVCAGLVHVFAVWWNWKKEFFLRNEILLLAKNTLVGVVKDNNGQTFLLGYLYGLNVTGGNGATGTAQGDRSGYTLTFSAQEKELAPAVDSGVFNALTTPGS